LNHYNWNVDALTPLKYCTKNCWHKASKGGEGWCFTWHESYPLTIIPTNGQSPFTMMSGDICTIQGDVAEAFEVVAP